MSTETLTEKLGAVGKKSSKNKQVDLERQAGNQIALCILLSIVSSIFIGFFAILFMMFCMFVIILCQSAKGNTGVQYGEGSSIFKKNSNFSSSSRISNDPFFNRNATSISICNIRNHTH